jgi:hypothetical protein
MDHWQGQESRRTVIRKTWEHGRRGYNTGIPVSSPLDAINIIEGDSLNDRSHILTVNSNRTGAMRLSL